MSKGSLFWGNARGRLGQSVFYRAGGEQRNRTYVAKIKNPRTRAQMKNRLSMSNFSNIFRAYQPVLQESFIGRPIKESGFNAFMRANKSASSAIILPEAKDQGLGVPLRMQISQGTISNYGVFGAHTATINGGSIGYIGYKIDATSTERAKYDQTAIASILGSSKAAVIDTAEKVQALFAAFGLPSDAVITILWAQYADEGFRMGLNSYSLEGISVSNTLGALSLIDDVNKAYGIGVNMGTDKTDEVQIAVVISHKVNGKLNCTTARITSIDNNQEFSAQFMEGGELYNEVMSQYSSGSALIANAQNTTSGGGGSNPDPEDPDPTPDPDPDPTPDPEDPEAEEVFIGTSVNDNAMGSVSGMGTYAKGEHVTLIANANEGYRFVMWGDEVTDNPRTVVAEINGVTYSAIFEAE